MEFNNNGFFIKIPKIEFINYSLIENPCEEKTNGKNIVFLYDNLTNFKKYENNQFLIYTIGDVIIPNNKSLLAYFMHKLPDIGNLLSKIKSHFYLIVYSKHDNKLIITSSMFSILPIYYYENKKYIYISSSIQKIKKYIDITSINKSFILERLLLNFSFNHKTIYNNIYLLNTNSYILIKNNLNIIKHTKIENLYSPNIISWKKSIEQISEIFINNVKHYFNSSKNLITLTGGFDGRTLTSLVHSINLPYKTFSYGEANSKDILIPLSLANNIGFTHIPFILNNKYFKDHYISHVERFIKYTEGNASFNRAHYSYVASNISNKYKFIISGNFGSELLRTMRIPGVLTSSFIFDIFSFTSEKDLKNLILNNKNLLFLNKTEYKKEIMLFLNEIIDYKKNIPPNLTTNQKFYIFLIEEVFRKYFGPEIIIQKKYGIYNRTPFLDYNFFISLLNSELSGSNGNFKEINPFSRFKGQLLYSYILTKKLNSPFANYPTDRGYSPKDFFNPIGKTIISLNYIKKILRSKLQENTNYNYLGLKHNIDYFHRLHIEESLYNKKHILASLNIPSTSLYHVLSLILYHNLS